MLINKNSTNENEFKEAARKTPKFTFFVTQAQRTSGLKDFTSPPTFATFLDNCYKKCLLPLFRYTV